MASSVNSPQSAADWPDPLTVGQLAEKLRELADLATGDGDHDFGTVFDTYRSAARLADKPALSLAECQQILRAVRESIPETGRWRSDLMVLNKHLFSLRRGLGSEVAGQVLPRILRSAADHVLSPRPESAEEGGNGHA